tara:strand:- start:313 stop:654 length:342 start_codon:yes stop_codon:yes gene_type:complete
MGTINSEVLQADLDFMIGETGKEFVGQTPAAITDKVFFGCFNALDDAYEVMMNGNEVTIDAEIVINGKAYPDLPTKGALLKDRDGNHFKVHEITKEDFGPGYVLKVIARYQRG